MAAPSSYQETVERDDRTVYFSSLLNGDASNFFGALVGNSATEIQDRTLADLLDTGPTGTEQQGMGEARRRDGSTIPVEFAVSTFESQGERSSIAVLNDISARIEVDRLRETFIGILSHELRTPVTSIYGGSQVLLARRDRLEQSAVHELVTEALMDAYIMTSRTSDVFRLAEGWLQKNPDDVDLMRRLAVLAGNEAIKGNNEFVKQGQDYGKRAIAQIDADRKPANMDVTKWGEYKTKNLVGLYRDVGILAMRAGDKATVKSSMEKAAELKSTDPAVYILLSQLANDEYQEQVKRYQSAFGPQKDAEHERSLKLLDHVIETYSQAVAMAEANPQYANAAKELRVDLEGYYKFRHNGSTDGLQGLIDRYKRP
jgi:hypothetical protein